MDIIRPMQLGFNQRVLEQNRQFYFTASATLGINLQTGEEQIDALFLKDAFQGNPDNPPLLDLGFPKPNGEFLLSGSYHCPSQSPVKGGEVTARIGNIEKKLYVFGPRKWQHGFPSEPEEITSMPLILQNAFGGEGYENNPVGRGFQDGLLPCIEYPKTLVASQKDKPLPACFSALDLMDPRRKKYKGTYNLDYKEKYFPGHPADMDWKMFLSTTDDQWHKGFFMGDEEYLLKNLHPEISRIEGKLPGLYARCFVNQKKQGEDTFGEIPLNLDTIWFFPEKMLALLIFRGVIKVDDDEAESITHVLGAYEYLSQSRRSLEYYHAALEKRIQNDDAFLKLLTTSDLIPEDHKCAMEVLFDMGVSETPEKSALVQNAEAKAAAMKKTADEEVEQAKKQAEKSMDDIDIPDQAMEFIPDDAKADLPGKKGGLDIGKLMDKKPDASPDPDIDILNQKMEEIFPGITSGDPKKMDMKNFSFDKFRGIADVAKEFSDKKKNDVMEDIKEKIESTKNDLKNQVDDIDKQINQIKKTGDKEGKSFDDEIKPLEEAKKQLQENMELIEIPDLDKPPEKMPLPRIDSEEIMSLLTQTPAFPPEIMEAMQHVQARKDMGIDDEKNRALEKEILAAEKKITDAMETTRKETEKQLSQIKNKFKSAYIMGAHHMEEGLSPHKESVDERKKHFLEAVSKNQDVSGQDWACIDLSGENLDGIDLSNAFLEQVNFKKASLKGANLSRSIMARTNLEEANLEGANLEGANIGGVHGLRTDFSQANMKSAKLSKSNFTGANFKNANMEKIEALELILTEADLSKVRISTVFFIDFQINGAKFCAADMELSMFVRGNMENVDFSDTVFNRCAFIDIQFNNVCFDRADLSNSVFVASSPEKSSMNNITFKQACLFQTNLQNMDMKGADLSFANLEKAFFWGADLTGANLEKAYAKGAQFRKAKLTGANLANINLYQGALAKADLVNASFKGANLCQADFLRSTITNTDFEWANLDLTLIEKWRPS